MIELEGDYYPRPPKLTQEEYDRVWELRRRTINVPLRLCDKELTIKGARGLNTRYCNMIDKIVVAAYERSGDKESLAEYRWAWN